MKLGLFSSFPPEHNAHVINTASIARAVQSTGVTSIIGLTSNAERPVVADFKTSPSDCLISPLEYPLIPVLNIYQYTDGYDLEDEVAELINRQRLDIVLMTYFPLFGSRFIEIMKRIKVKILLLLKLGYVPDDEGPLFSSYHRDYEKGLNNADRLFVSQQKDSDLLVSRYPSTGQKIGILPKFVDSELLKLVSTNITTVLEKYGLSDFFNGFGKTLGYVGRLDAEKNVRLLLEDIWPKVLAREPDCGLLVVGRGSEEKYLKQRFRNMNVHFIANQVSHLETLCILSKLDVLACPSGYDYTPRIPMEALISGTEVVLNDQNFNDVYLPYAHVVPIKAMGQYIPTGFIDHTNSLRGVTNVKQFGIPDSDLFADEIVEAFNNKKADAFPSNNHDSQGFISALKEHLVIE